LKNKAYIYTTASRQVALKIYGMQNIYSHRTGNSRNDRSLRWDLALSPSLPVLYVHNYEIS